MKDVSYPLKQAYYALINGAITLKGVVVPIYDKIVPDWANRPYILLSSMNTQLSSSTNNSGFQFRTSSLFDIVTGYLDGYGGTSDCLLITNQLLGILIPNSPTSIRPLANALLPNFKVITTKLSNMNTLDGMDETMHVVRNLVRIEHTIEQLN